MNICQTSPELLKKLKDLRFRKATTLAAIIMKINVKELVIVAEEEFEDVSFEDVLNELPPQHPRYVALSYPLKHSDGRVSYPLIFVFISPQDTNPQLQMTYAGSKSTIERDGAFTKVMEFRSLEEFTEEAIQEKLKRLG